MVVENGGIIDTCVQIVGYKFQNDGDCEKIYEFLDNFGKEWWTL